MLCVLLLQAQTMVYLERSHTLSFDEERLPDAQILRGDVCFRHDSALMYCDSAYFYERENSLTAFGHVRIVQGDTLKGYGDILYYDGNRRLARLRRHVRLVHRSTVLTTDSLNYDRAANFAYYFSGGTIRDSLNTLVSRWGQYTPSTSQAVFRDAVRLDNPRFLLTADTLLYNTESKIANLVGPTTIVYEGETTILSSRGIYNTKTEQSELYDRSRVIHTDGKSLTGDTIYYDKLIGFGRVRGNMQTDDSLRQVSLYGHYGEMYEENSVGYVTREALMVDRSDSTDYTYMHADTLFTEEIPWSDSLPDSTWHRVRAHHHVRIYRSDTQSVCDSAVFNGRDSVVHLFLEPVCWNDDKQLSADTIHIYLHNDEVDHIDAVVNALAVQQLPGDSLFNQMSGKQITAQVEDGHLTRMTVSGNAETRFYPDDNGEFIGLNTTQSSYVRLFFQDEKLDHIVFTSQTTGTLFPLDQIPAGEDRLAGFFYAEQERPRRPGDVLLHPERTPRPAVSSTHSTDIP